MIAFEFGNNWSELSRMSGPIQGPMLTYETFTGWDSRGAVLIPVQLVFGHLCGEYVVRHQPAKMATIEARWRNQKPAYEVLLAWPDEARQEKLFAITFPRRCGV